MTGRLQARVGQGWLSLHVNYSVVQVHLSYFGTSITVCGKTPCQITYLSGEAEHHAALMCPCFL